MQRLEVSGAVRPMYGLLGFKRLKSDLNKGYFFGGGRGGIFSTDFRKMLKYQIFKYQITKYQISKFHENACSGSRVVAYGETDMAILLFAFRNLGNAPKKEPSNVLTSEICNFTISIA